MNFLAQNQRSGGVAAETLLKQHVDITLNNNKLFPVNILKTLTFSAKRKEKT